MAVPLSFDADTIPPPRTDAGRALLENPPDEDLFIGAARLPADGGGYIESRDPASGRLIARIARGGPRDVDAAVAAARRALEGPWSAMTPRERSRILYRTADLIDAHADALSELETLDQGKPWSVSRWAEIPAAAHQFRFFAGQALSIEGRTIAPSLTYQPKGREVHAWTLREPVGVVAAITPWNSPLVLTAMKLAPALAAGCAVVHKPAELTSLTALRLAELLTEAGLPEGAINVVTGLGGEAGAALAANPGVDKIAFTGSTATGRAIAAAGAGNLNRVSLELGGKSPAVVLADADLDLVIPGVANAIFFNAGQVCVANSRAYIHRSVYDKVVAGVAEYGARMRMGHGLARDTEMGPVVSPAQADRIEDYLRGAQKDGAAILSGGERLGPRGAFIQPTIVAQTRPEMRIVREEVFGPVLVAEPFDEPDDALAAANDTEFGLAASVWTRDFSSAQRFSRHLRAGVVWINGHSLFDAAMPVGGIRQSGYGRDSGVTALDNYLEWKTVCAVV